MSTSSPNSGGSDLLTRMTLPFCPPHMAELGEEQRREHSAVVSFIYIGATIIFGFASLNLKHGNFVAAGVQYVSVAIVLAMLLANRRGYSLFAAHVCVAMTSVTIFIGMWTGGGMEAAAIVFLPMIPAVGLLSVGASGGIAGGIQAVAVVVLVAALEKHGFVPRHDPPDKLFAKRVAESIAVVLQIWLVCHLFFRLKNDAFALLSQKRDELASLFDNMRQGVLAFTVDGKVTGQHSRTTRAIFGMDKLEGAPVSDLLYGAQPEFDLGRQEFAVWLEAVAMSSAEEFAGMLSLAPEHCVRRTEGGAEQHLRLEFRPILEDGRLARVMLLVTDETEQVMFRRAADAQKVAGERALDRMRRLAAGGAYGFLETLRGAEGRLDEITRTLGLAGELLTMAELNVMFRASHTVKGDARLHDLERLGHAAEALERVFDEVRMRLAAGETIPAAHYRAEVEPRIDEAHAAIAAARDGLVAASPIGAAILDQVTVRGTDLRTLRQHVMRMHMALGEQVTPLSEATSRLLSRPFGESAAGLPEAVERWSVEHGKRAGTVLGGKEVSVPPELHEVLPGVLGHLVRNAVAHGIESPDNRLRTGKPERGLVRIECVETSEGPAITVEDDGAGIDLTEIARRARERGIEWSGKDPMELIFVDGLSTADDVDELRGRGVGMSAVQADLRKVGYVIDATSERGRGTRFVLRRGLKGKHGKAA